MNQIPHLRNKDTFLLNIEDWISINSGKKIGITITEKVKRYVDYSATGKRNSSKKEWYERTRNIEENKLQNEYNLN